MYTWSMSSTPFARIVTVLVLYRNCFWYVYLFFFNFLHFVWFFWEYFNYKLKFKSIIFKQFSKDWCFSFTTINENGFYQINRRKRCFLFWIFLSRLKSARIWTSIFSIKYNICLYYIVLKHKKQFNRVFGRNWSIWNGCRWLAILNAWHIILSLHCLYLCS